MKRYRLTSFSEKKFLTIIFEVMAAKTGGGIFDLTNCFTSAFSFEFRLKATLLPIEGGEGSSGEGIQRLTHHERSE